MNWDIELKRRNKVRGRTYYRLLSGVTTLKPCQICHSTENIDMHHEDYDEPDKITYLCRKHHMKVHGNMEKYGIGKYSMVIHKQTDAEKEAFRLRRLRRSIIALKETKNETKQEKEQRSEALEETISIKALLNRKDNDIRAILDTRKPEQTLTDNKCRKVLDR